MLRRPTGWPLDRSTVEAAVARSDTKSHANSGSTMAVLKSVLPAAERFSTRDFPVDKTRAVATYMVMAIMVDGGRIRGGDRCDAGAGCA